jgi:chitinase
MTDYSFDGIDIDWEYPVTGGSPETVHRPEDADHFVLLVQELRSRLNQQEASDGRKYLLTVASPCAYDTVTSQLKLADMSPHLDWFNVMTYHYSGDWNPTTGHNAPLYSNPGAPAPDHNVDKTVRTYLEQGVPPGKIVIGVPFFGIGFKDVTAVSNGLFQMHGGTCSAGSWESGIFDYKDLVAGTRSNQYVNSQGFTRYWDSLSRVPYLYNPTSHVWISYDDEESVRAKVEYAISNQLGGVMYWSMDQDTRDASLQKTIYQAGYPFRVGSTPHAGDAALELSWYGLTGQTYVVDCRSDLMESQWNPCASLVGASNVSTSRFVGMNQRIIVRDTNFPSARQQFYRVGHLAPP